MDYFTPYGIDQMACVVDVNEATAARALTAFPNPATEEVQVNLPAFEGAVQLQVTDLAGRVVEQFTTASTVARFNVADWPQGAYTVQVMLGDRLERISLVVTH